MYRSGCEGQDTGLYTNLLIMFIVTRVSIRCIILILSLRRFLEKR